MLGWHISVYRQEGDGSKPEAFETPRGVRIAVWQAELRGLDWVEQLIGEGKATHLGGNGYPFRFAAQAALVLPIFTDGPPEAREPWVTDPGDVLTSKWKGKTTIDEEAVKSCEPGEWLIIEAWDES